MTQYLARAKLEWQWEWEDAGNGVEFPSLDKLPVEIGPFTIDQSPNVRLYLEDIGLIEPGRVDWRNRDWQFPVSWLYVQGKVTASGSTNLQQQTDDCFELLECLFRLYQPGKVAIQRHDWIGEVKEREVKPIIPFHLRPIKPLPSALYGVSSFPLDDDFLDCFVQFFNSYWGILKGASPPLSTALTRFSSSYERRRLSDRLIDLITALEALFGDGDPSSVTYKVSARCAGWLHPPGGERYRKFCVVKALYSTRSKILHGRQYQDPCQKKVEQLECIVRQSIMKFLDTVKSDGNAPRGNRIDEIIMSS